MLFYHLHSKVPVVACKERKTTEHEFSIHPGAVFLKGPQWSTRLEMRDWLGRQRILVHGKGTKAKIIAILKKHNWFIGRKLCSE